MNSKKPNNNCSVSWRALAPVALVVLLAASPASAALVAHYTFDDADTTRTGDGTEFNPYQGSMVDASGNGNTVSNTATLLSATNPPFPAVYGMAILPGQPGLFCQSHRFWRDTSDYNLISANTTWTLAPGVVPVGAAPRTIMVWFNQEVDVTAGGSQDKLWGYGSATAGQALDLSLEGGGLRIRHFGGNITYGSGYDFAATGANAGWHHATVRVNAGATTFANVDVFLDGVKLTVSATVNAGTNQSINTVENAAPSGYPGYGFGIGTQTERSAGSSQNGLQGWLDEMRIYDTALSDAEIAALAVPPAKPVLSVWQVGNTVKVGWSTNFACFELENTASLAPTNWQPAGAPVVEGTNNVVTIASPVGNSFFRLKN